MSAADSQYTPSYQQRSGFTLIELLFAMSIIGVLMSLTIVVMNGLQEQAERDATKVTIRKVNGLLQQRLEAFHRAFRGSLSDQYIRDTVTLLLRNVHLQYQHFRVHPDEAPAYIKVLAKKAAVRFELPQRFMDRTGSGEPASAVAAGMPMSVYRRIAFPNARTQLIQEGNPAPTKGDVEARVAANWVNHTAETESAELLHFALISSGTFGAAVVDADQFTDREIADTDGDGLPEFVDAWGKPLRFYRWPTRLVDPDAPDPFQPILESIDATEQREISTTERKVAGLLIKGLPPAPINVAGSISREMMFIDPDDPIGLLYSAIENRDLLDMGIELRNEINEGGYHTLDTWHTPLIVSAGPDGNLGLREPNEWNSSSGIYGNLAQLAGTTTAAPLPTGDVLDDLTDNVVNRNMRAGGRR